LGTGGTTEWNLMRTSWKHSENTLGTDKKTKNPLPPPSLPKGKTKPP